MGRKSVLDCESPDAALRSLASILSTTPRKLRERLESIPFSHYETVTAADDQRRWLWRETVGDEEPPTPDVVHWFHVTRIVRDTDFSEGLLPLPEVADRFRILLSKLTGRRASEFVGNEHFQRKVADRMHWGPYGQLVKSFAVGDGSKFFRTPEIVEDLALNEGDLVAYRAASVPCLVRFRSHAPHGTFDVIAIALHYCYESLMLSEAPCILCSTTWDGEGRAVPSEDIIAIEWPEAASIRAEYR